MHIRILIIFVFLFLLNGCANHQYSNPSDTQVVPIYGTFESRESYVDFIKGISPLSDFLGNGALKNPIIVIAEIDGLNVGDSQVPTYLTPGKHIVKVGVSDRKRIAYVNFSIDVKLGTIYKAKYSISSIENTELVKIWIEDFKSGESITNKKSAALLRIKKDPVIIPVIL